MIDPKQAEAVSTTELKPIVFKNIAPEDKEWTAHVSILNRYTNRDYILRHIIQYARSGAFYPADMHVDLIEQYQTQLIPEEVVKELEALLKHPDMTLKVAKHIDNRIRKLRGGK